MVKLIEFLVLAAIITGIAFAVDHEVARQAVLAAV
jgi:hypothetical protein